MRRWVGCLLALALSGCTQGWLRPAPGSGGYHVVYRIEDRTGSRPRVSFESVEIRRPYDGRVEDHAAGAVVSGRVTNRDDLWLLGANGTLRFGIRRIPAGPSGDASYEAFRDAADAGVVQASGRAQVLGRRCAWFAFGNLPPKPLSAPTAQTRIESCLAADGIVLAQAWRISGRTARIVRAVKLDTSLPSPRRFFEGKDPAKLSGSEAQAARLVAGQFAVSDEVEGLPAPPIAVRPPDGWRRDRRAVVSEAQGGGPSSRVLVETFVRGPSIVVVQRAIGPSTAPAWPAEEGSYVDLGPLGAGRIAYFPERVEYRLTQGGANTSVAAPSRRVAMSFVRRLELR